MKKTIIAAALSAAVAAPAAMAEVSLYGKAHMAYEFGSNNYDDSSTADADKIASRASRFGIKASEDLGNGMSAFVKYEFGADAIDGTNGLTARDALMGIKGDFGTISLGRMGAPVKGVLYGVGNVQLADANGGDDFAGGFFSKGTRSNNVTAYSNSFNGVNVTIGTSGTDASSTSAAGDNFDGKHISLSTNVGGVKVALGNYDTTSEDALILGAKMSMDALTVAVVHEEYDTTTANGDYDTTGISASYAMGANVISASFSTRDHQNTSTKDIDRTTFGVEHKFSKKTSAYISYSDKDAGVTNTNDSMTSVGMIMNF